MKKILITGAGSYVGTSVEKYLMNWPEEFDIQTLDMTGDSWKLFDFSGFDVVYHVAGLAHSDVGKVTEEIKKKYYAVNTDLTISVAKKAKESGVKQFIFMSSAIVYGDSAPIGKKKVITRDTPVSPSNFYGDSKVKAENGIIPLSDDSFKVVILRCPMIYGKGSKGNFAKLEKLASNVFFFPNIINERSVLFIDNLAEFIRLIIYNDDCGMFWPQNAEYINTSELVHLIAKQKGKKVILVGGVTWVLKLLSRFFGSVNKAFGNLSYAQELSTYKENYRIFSTENSIKAAEKESGCKTIAS